MSMFNNLRNYPFKEPGGEGQEQRTEILITLTLAVLSTLLALLAYRNPVTLTTVVITNLIGLVTLFRAYRGQYKFLNFFPTITSFSICIVTIFEGQGTHDLLWMGNLGLFLLANIQSRKSLLFPIFLAVLMIATFAATGFAEMNGILNNRYETTAQYIYSNSFFFAAIMAAILAIFQRHYYLLQMTTEDKSALLKSYRELKNINQTLESHVESHTQELREANEQMQIRTARMQVISGISQEISSSMEGQLQEFLDHTIRVISERLDHYHVGIFLLDENREFAVLRAANSRGGQRMLERRHQLRVGGTGIVGYVSQGGRPRIALDTGLDAVFFNNPDLPETRSEMAIPLKYGSQVIGVLDVQSTVPAAFKEDDANFISILANQISIAINTILIREQSGSNVPYAKLDRKTTPRQKQSGYSYNAGGTISAVATMDNPILKKALSNGNIVQTQSSKEIPPTLAVPVKFRDQVIGIIHVEAADTDRQWTEDEITVVQSISDRAAFALENARLLEQTRQRADQEETIARITSQIGASTDFSHILQTTVEELGRTLGATRTFIQLETSADEDAPVHQAVTD